VVNKTTIEKEFQSVRESLQRAYIYTSSNTDFMEELSKKYNEITDLIPGGLPDGTGIFTPISWIKWAKKQLGYDEKRS